MNPNKSKERDMISVPGDKNDSKHRVSVTISDPNHTMASMRKEKMEKRIRLHANDAEHAVALAKAHYKRQGYKVHDAQHIGISEETKMNEAVTVKKANYSWGKMVTVHHGAETSYPLHPEHQKAIKRLRNGDKTSFKDETGRNVHVHREGDKVHLMSKEGNYKPTTVDYKHFDESVEQIDERLKVTHEDPLVTVHDKDGLHTHANLSVANHIFQTNVKHTDVHKGPVKVKSGGSYGNVTFAISQHHAADAKKDAMKEENMNTFKTFRTALEEKTLTPAEKKKREEVAQAIERENPGMPMAKKMAIATAQAKKVAEEVILEGEDAQKRFSEYHSDTAKLMKGIHKALSTHYELHNKGAHWGHVGDIRHIHDQLRDIHDRLHETGEYAKQDKALRDKHAAMMKESVDEDMHYCAKHVRSAILGDGVVLEAQHADPDDNGDIEWYMVEFKTGVHKVFTEDLEIMIAEYHGNHKKKKRMTNG